MDLRIVQSWINNDIFRVYHLLIVSENEPFGIGNQLASFCGFLSSKKPCNVVSFRLDEEQYLYLKRTAGVMYEKGLIKSSNIGALSKLVTLCWGDISSHWKETCKKTKGDWLKRLLIKDEDELRSHSQVQTILE